MTEKSDLFSSFPRVSITRTVQQQLKKIEILQNIFSKQKHYSASLITQQRQILGNLKNLTAEPLGAIGYVTACCMTDTDLIHIFDYQKGNKQHTDYILLKNFFEPRNIFPLLQKYNVLDKVYLPVFTEHFPNLKEKPFDPAVYDALNTETNGKSFASHLAELLHQQLSRFPASDLIDTMARNRYLSVIDDLARKGYPSVQLLKAQIHSQKHPRISSALITAVLCNKYSSAEHIKTAGDFVKAARKQPIRTVQIRSHTNQSRDK